MRSITLKQLRIVAAIVRSGKIVGAANELNVTPPAVTLQLKLLEEAVGLPLFERTKRGMRPTEACMPLIDAAQRVASVLNDCAAALQTLRGLGGGTVSVGLVSTARYFAPKALAKFVEAFPHIELKLMVGNREQTLAALERLELDIAITGYPPDSMPVEKRVIGDHPHIIIAPSQHRVALRKRLALGDLENETFLVREPGSGTRLLMERFFREAEIAPRIGMEVDSNETIKQAVMAGLGLAFISAHTVAAEVETGRLAVLSVAGLPVMRKWYAVRHAEKRHLPAPAAMWDFLVSDAARFLPHVALRRHSPSPKPERGTKSARSFRPSRGRWASVAER